MCRKNVSEKIGQLMQGEERNEMRMRVKETRRKLESAVGAGGSSVKNFDSFVEDLKNHKVGK